MTTRIQATILLVDDDPQVLAALEDQFEGEYVLLTAASGSEAIAQASLHPDIAAVVLDIKMEGIDGLTAGSKIREILPYAAIIFHTGYPGDYEERVIDARERPFDYIEKGCSSVRVKRAVRNGVDAYRLKTTGRLAACPDAPNFGLIGQSQAILKVIRDIIKVAYSDHKVMIRGENGTGKELVAKAIHGESGRRHMEMAVLHCNHKSPDLIVSELFGHLRGAFTGAIASRVGIFEKANGSTVFLDEIGDLDITTQAKLLRVLESGEFTRIGDPGTQRTNIRLLCATHKNLEAMVKDGTFREDLYYRLKGVQIQLPALRERREDIPILVEHFVNKYSENGGRFPKLFDQSALDCLIRFDWPGNVRHLKDTVESVLLLADSDLIGRSDIESYLGLHDGSNGNHAEADGLTAKIDAYKRTLVIHALRQTDGNMSAAATLLQIDKANLRKYLIDRQLLSE